MGILNVTPDSFSDGGAYRFVDDALRQVEMMIREGADIVDVGGESTRPGSSRVAADDEIVRTAPVIDEIVKRFDLPISIDTTKSEVASRAIDAGAEILNDISGLRWDERMAQVAALSGAGLALMHSRGRFETMHSLAPVDDIFADIASDFERAIGRAKAHGVMDEQIALDVGIGFGKTQEQNLELLAKLDKIVADFKKYPMMVGVSRKSFLGKILGETPVTERLAGSVAAALAAIGNGAAIIRVHDVSPTVQAIRVSEAICERGL